MNSHFDEHPQSWATSGLYNKPVTLVNDSRVINKLETSLTNDARVIIYYCHIFRTGHLGAKLRLTLYIPANIRLTCKNVAGINTLNLFLEASVTKKKFYNIDNRCKY
jgi:hypothetical protein